MGKCKICGAEKGSCPAEFIEFARTGPYEEPEAFGTSGVLMGTELSSYPLMVFRKSMIARIQAHWPDADIKQVSQGMYVCPYEWKED